MENELSMVSVEVRYVEITEHNQDQRVDNFLISTLKGVPKSRIYRMLRKGEVRVNKKRCKAALRLVSGDLVRIPPVRTATREATVFVPAALRQSLQNDILYEDDALLVINKPSGFAVHGGSGVNSGVIEALRVIRPENAFLELVHRLDRDTSGCLLIAKKRPVLRKLHELFRGDGVEKSYLALLSGRWSRKKLRVDVPLQKNVRKGGERQVMVCKQGKQG